MKHKEKAKRSALYLLGVILYYVWFQTFYNMVAFNDFFPYSNLSEVMIGVAFNFTPILALSLLNIAIVFRLTPGIRPDWLKTVLDISLSVIATIAVNFCYLVILHYVFHRQGTVDWAGSFMNDVLILLITEMSFYIMHYREARLREEQQQHLNTRMQYDILKTQVNPHFLFNSLNILYSLSSIDIDKTRDFILNLSLMYRYILTQQRNQRIRVKEELEFIQSYIKVLEMRYPESFFVEITGHENARDRDIIPYSLQLLIRVSKIL